MMVQKYIKENKGHVWETDPDGDIDIFAYNPSDPHNGPRCVNCGYGFCHHCEAVPDKWCSYTKKEDTP